MSSFPEHDLTDQRVLRGKNTSEERQRARLTVARAAHGVYDCAQLLEMLGLVEETEVLTVVVP